MPNDPYALCGWCFSCPGIAHANFCIAGSEANTVGKTDDWLWHDCPQRLSRHKSNH